MAQVISYSAPSKLQFDFTNAGSVCRSWLLRGFTYGKSGLDRPPFGPESLSRSNLIEQSSNSFGCFLSSRKDLEDCNAWGRYSRPKRRCGWTRRYPHLNTEAFSYVQYKYKHKFNTNLIHHLDVRLSVQSYFVWVFSAPASCANYGNGHLHIMWAFQFSQSLFNNAEDKDNTYKSLRNYTEDEIKRRYSQITLQEWMRIQKRQYSG